MPNAVLALDAFLNREIASACDTVDLYRWWVIKVRAKRLLALADARHVPLLAERILRVLQTETTLTVRQAA